MTFSSNRPHSQSSRRKRHEDLLKSAVHVKCKFCGNSFLARPEVAVCQKCGRPANRAMQTQWRAISLLLPPIGLGNAFLIKAHSPVAAVQGFLASTVGLAVYGAVYGLVRLLPTLF